MKKENTEMKGVEARKVLVDSKHVVRKLSKDEKTKMAKETGVEKERQQEEDKMMEEGEKTGRSDLFSDL